MTARLAVRESCCKNLAHEFAFISMPHQDIKIQQSSAKLSANVKANILITFHKHIGILEFAKLGACSPLGEATEFGNYLKLTKECIQYKID